MSLLRLIYLGLAIWGAVHPMYYLFPWAQVNELDFPGLLELLRANAVTTALFWNVTISAITVSVFVIAEVSVRRNWGGLLAIPATLLFGVSCGLPLYLFLRTRPVS